MKISSSGNGLRSYFSRFSRKYVIGIAAFCIISIVAALLLANEVNGACTRYRPAKENYQEWISWIDDRGIDIQDMRTAPYAILVSKYGTEVAENRRNFYDSSSEFRTAQSILNFTEFCFAE